jgi:hypothetical protein
MCHSATQPVHFILRGLINGRVQVLLLLLLQFKSAPCYFFLLRPKHVPVQPIIGHTQHVFYCTTKDQVSQKHTGVVDQVIKTTPKIWAFHWNSSHSHIAHLEYPFSVFSIHPRKSLRNGLFAVGFQTKILSVFLIPVCILSSDIAVSNN